MKIKQSKNIFPNVQVARYNLGVWKKPNADTLSFIGREVAKAGGIGEPDTGVLKLFEIDSLGKVVHERVIWKPLYDGINLEDPRALQLPDENLIIGLTCVLRDKFGKPVSYPAIVKIDSVDSWRQNLPPFLVIDSFGPGKNITPLDKNIFLFRPESSDYFHKLIVFSLVSQVPKKLSEIVFPLNLPWALWRVGTAMPPIWLDQNEALFIVHGITKQIIEGKEKYVYSIGRAKLMRNGDEFTVKVAPDPILTPDDFLNSEGRPLIEELHPDLRRVVYSCGGIVDEKTGNLSLFVNVGDRATFEVEFSLAELKEGLF
jgi:predicted GH43/DUF377 family glycosyl hydrolase